MVYSHGGHIVQPRSTPLGIFWDKVHEVKPIEPIISPSVSEIPLTLWQQMLGFFLWSQKEFKGEAQISGFYNQETKTWHFEPLPQHSVGMTTKEIEGPEREQILNDLRSRGYTEITFTGHHHCTSSAFQSGTDQDDEFKNKGSGFHITIGKLDQKIFDLDCRAKLCAVGKFDQETGKLLEKGVIGTGKFLITDLVEVPGHVHDYPEPLKGELAKHHLLRNDAYEFPPEWKDRVSKPVYQPTSRGLSNGHWTTAGDRMMFIPDNKKDDPKPVVTERRQEALDAARFLHDCEEIHSGKTVVNDDATTFMEDAYRVGLAFHHTPQYFDDWINGLLFDELEQFVNPDRWTMEQIVTELLTLKNPVGRYAALLSQLQQDEFMHEWIDGVMTDVIETWREEAANEVDEQISRFVGKQDEFDPADGEEVEAWEVWR